MFLATERRLRRMEGHYERPVSGVALSVRGQPWRVAAGRKRLDQASFGAPKFLHFRSKILSTDPFSLGGPGAPG